MVIANSLILAERPRISSNQLGLFPFATAAEKLRILRDQKFGNIVTAPYYQPALSAILGSFDGEDYSVEALKRAIDALRQRPAANRNQQAKWENNAEMLRRFASISTAVRPPAGDHRIVRQNATMELEGVTVSVRPEIVTLQRAAGLFSYTKLRFSKSRVSDDASEIILLVLLKFGQRQNGERQLDPEGTRLVDCYARNVVAGHTVPRYREQQLSGALREINRLWPTIHEVPGAPIRSIP
jgi:hypothetical protein